jgi:polygalacturonase
LIKSLVVLCIVIIHSFTMHFFKSSIVAALLGSALVAAAPAAELEARGSCTFKSASAAKSGKKSCSTITLDNIAVPAGETLDLTGLKTGTTVRSQDPYLRDLLS